MSPKHDTSVPKISLRSEIDDDFCDALRISGQKAEQILIGDGSHSDAGVRSFVSSEKMIKALAEAGCLHLCLEIPDVLSAHVQDLYNGKISRDDFVRNLDVIAKYPHKGGIGAEEFYGSMADSILLAKKYGMQAHAVDPGDARLEFLAYTQHHESLMLIDFYNQGAMPWNRVKVDYTKSEPQIDNQASERINRFADRLGQGIKRAYEKASGKPVSEDLEQQNKELKTFAARESYYQRRFNTDRLFRNILEIRFNDGNLYKNVMNATGGQKFALIYGAGHDRIASRLAGFMGTDSLIADIYPDRAVMRVVDSKDRAGKTWSGQPHFVYFTGEGKGFTTQKAWGRITDDIKLSPLKEPEPKAPAATAPTAETPTAPATAP